MADIAVAMMAMSFNFSVQITGRYEKNHEIFAVTKIASADNKNEISFHVYFLLYCDFQMAFWAVYV
jgi:hypothetical protein